MRRIPIGLMIVLSVIIWRWARGRNGEMFIRLLIVLGWIIFWLWFFYG